MSVASGNLRVFVDWHDQAVYAGERLRCRITLRNNDNAQHTHQAARPEVAYANSVHATRTGAQGPGLVKHVDATKPTKVKGHRATASLSAASPGKRTISRNDSWTNTTHSSNGESSTHRRSLSILSMGAADSQVFDSGLAKRNGANSRNHGRSASLQTMPTSRPSEHNPVSRGSTYTTINTAAQAMHDNYSVPSLSDDQNSRNTKRPGTVSNGRKGLRRSMGSASLVLSPQAMPKDISRGASSTTSPQDFQFPSTTTSPSIRSTTRNGFLRADSTLATLPIDQQSPPTDAYKAARVPSPKMASDTPRSSGDFYSLSNNSNDTLVSEYLPTHLGRRTAHRPMNRVPASANAGPTHSSPETIMMGFAQTSGSFSLDASLIDQRHFEDIKNRSATGPQTGGVVGLNNNRDSASLLGGFGWAKFGSPLSNLLGSNELSSLKSMRDATDSRAIPLLSTPQSILFVDLTLSPGESKTFDYMITIPRGLPPSHRGKAIKITYKLIIGIQRPDAGRKQNIQCLEVPFRVLPSVDNNGQILGHDLMSPYTMNHAQGGSRTSRIKQNGRLQDTSIVESQQESSSLDEFADYIGELLLRPRQNSSIGLVSPTVAFRRGSSLTEANGILTAKDAIDQAVQQGGQDSGAQRNVCRFEITRNGKKIAVIILSRPAYRLGETITLLIDFSDAEVSCYATHMSLESHEVIDKQLAMRSESSILRVTRKVHASQSESTLFARRITFAPTIPVIATPSFITSGVSLEWKLRIEFVTSRTSSSGQRSCNALLEEILHDDRGSTAAACENIACEAFDIAVPLCVYGAIAATKAQRIDAATGSAP